MEKPNYALGYAFDLKELFEHFNVKKLDYSLKEHEAKHNNRNRKAEVRKVFKECMKMVMNDIVDNNDIFVLPVGGKRAEIHMKKFLGDEFIQARKNGKFQDIDFLKSFYTGYLPVLYTYRSTKIYELPIYLGGELRLRMIDNINNGKLYC